MMNLKFSEEVSAALSEKKPVVALESTVIAHGLPYPQNVATAKSLEQKVRDGGAIPATIAVFDGEFCVGIGEDKIQRLATDKNIRKISRRDLPIAAARRLNCATTVATTAFIAHAAGIRVFATGGIGGVILIGDYLLVNKFIFAPGGKPLPFMPQREIERGLAASSLTAR